jgi:CBS domain-containing protein
MKTIAVKDRMVLLEEYATVSEEASLYEAVLSLEKAQNSMDSSQHKHRAILVLDRNGSVIGKVSMFDILIALEPRYEDLEDVDDVLSRTGYSPESLQSMFKENLLWDEPMEHICSRAPKLVVKDFMQIPSEGVYIEEDATLNEAIHRLVFQRHHSLLVTRSGAVVGILRLSDVFAEICGQIKACGF